MKRSAWLLVFLSLTLGSVHGATAPDFNLKAPDGSRVQLSELLKKGPVVLDFWATWCKPCIKGMPELNEIFEKYKDRGLSVVGLNEDGPRGQNRIRPFLNGHNINFQIAIDADGSVMKRLQVQALPTTLLIAPDGEIILRQAGLSDSAPLLEAIEGLLAKKEAADEVP
jgi:cytochrome c biogenesis protein CcmG, thiol:disulfide interchange protein DsbE